MKGTYWFTRPYTPPKEAKSQPKTIKTPQKIDTSCRHALQKPLNEATAASKALLAIVQQLEQFKKNNLWQHAELVEEGAIKQLKCLRHQSAVILYSTEDKKLLCSVCAFATQKYAKHSMIEARLAHRKVEQYVSNCERIFQIRTQDIQEQKNHWDKAFDKIHTIRDSALKNIQKEYDELTASIATQYKKCLIKIEETFEQSKNNLSFIIDSFSRYIDSLHFQHSIATVRQLYFQEVMEKWNDLGRLPPSLRLAQRMPETLKILLQVTIKGFRQYGSTLKR